METQGLMSVKHRAVLVLVDGLGDVSIPDLDYLTPLQVATTPNLDAMAACGLTGLMDPVEPGLACGSDTAHLSILGYPPREFYKGRGAFESMGAGIAMNTGDIAFKCNFSTVDDSTGIVTHRRADRHFEEEGPILCRHLDGLPIPGYPEVTVNVKYATEHRCGVVVRGANLSNNISGTDPLKDNRPLHEAQPLDNTPEARHTADVINAISAAFRSALKEHEINKERVKSGKIPANVVLLRGCGIRIEAPAFDAQHGISGACMVAPTKIIAGLGMSLGFNVLHVPEATGDYRTNLAAKAGAIASAVSSPSYCSPPAVMVPGEDEPQPGRDEGYDFGFLHIKGVDDAGHDKDLVLKVKGLEAVDEMIGQLAKRLWEAEKTGKYKFVVSVTGDHSTPVLYGDHSFEPVPFLVCRLKDFVELRGEEYLASVKLARIGFPQAHGSVEERVKELKKGLFGSERGVEDGLEQSGVLGFDEMNAGRGILGRFPGSEMMPVILSFMRGR